MAAAGTTAVKVTNPFHGSGEDDGIVNGTDRLNSYAWAMIKRGDNIYIGTNRAFISSEVYGAITRMAPMFGENDIDKLYEIFNYFTYGELPDYTKLTDEECVPEIIKLNPKTGKTEILELPSEFKEIATKAEGFKYVLDVSLWDILNTYLKSLNEALEMADQTEPQGRAKARSVALELDSGDEALLESVRDLADQLEALGFSTDDNSEGEEISLTVKQVEKLSESMLALQEAAEEPDGEETAALDNGNENWKPAIIEKLKTIIDSIDKDGLKMVVEMKRQLNANTSGFDLLKTADGEKWSFVLDDGFHDKYNFGGRTMVVFDDQLYVGTANSFYGAQLWRIDDGKESETTCLCLRPVQEHCWRKDCA